MAVRRMLIAGRYRLLEPVGSGGMGRVWLARDEMLDRDVAVKEFVPPDWMTDDEKARLRDRTLREARSAGRLNHPHVVRVYDVVHAEGLPWIVMEYVESRSLHQVINDDGPYAPASAARIGLAVLDALSAAHRAGVLHRDVKPHNVLIGTDGRVVLTDFGLATFVDDGSVTGPGLVVGSPQYVSPERARDGASTVESDMWSLGATLYAAVEGRSPYARDTAMATLMALATEPPNPPERAGLLGPVLLGLLRHDPATRLTAGEVERRLRMVVAASPGGSGVPSPRRARSAAAWSAAGSAVDESAVSGSAIGESAAAGLHAAGSGAAGSRAAGPGVAGSHDAGSAAASHAAGSGVGGSHAVGTVAGSHAAGSGVGDSHAAGSAVAGSRAAGAAVAGSTVAGAAMDAPAVGVEPAQRAVAAVRASGHAVVRTVPAQRITTSTASPTVPPREAVTVVPAPRSRPRLLAAGMALVAVLGGGGILASYLVQRADVPAAGGPSAGVPSAGPSSARAIVTVGFSPVLCGGPAPSSAPSLPRRGAARGVSGWGLLPGWSYFADGSGFHLPAPDGWTYQKIGTMYCFRDPENERVLSLDTGRNPAGDPVKACRTEAARLVAAGALPGYEEILIETRPLLNKAADWEYRYQDSSGTLLHAQTRWFVTDGRAYALSWATREIDWTADLPKVNMIMGMFYANRV